MKGLKSGLLLTVALVAVCGGVWYVRKTRTAVTEDQKENPAAVRDDARKSAGPVAAATNQGAVAAAKGAQKGAVKLADQKLDKLSQEAQQAIDAVQDDLDSADAKVSVAAARKIMNHPDPEVRLKAVETLAFAQAEGFADLNKMLLDSDPEVAAAALSEWSLQMQTMENSKDKNALLEDVGKMELANGADAFQDVLDAMMETPDAQALIMLQGWALQTTDADILEKIVDAVNFRAQPEENITSKDQIQQAITDFNAREAAERAAEESAGGGVQP